MFNTKIKYNLNNLSNVIVPAPLTDEQTKKVCDIALNAYNIAGCNGVTRIEFIMQAAEVGRLSEGVNFDRTLSTASASTIEAELANEDVSTAHGTKKQWLLLR